MAGLHGRRGALWFTSRARNPDGREDRNVEVISALPMSLFDFSWCIRYTTRLHLPPKIASWAHVGCRGLLHPPGLKHLIGKDFSQGRRLGYTSWGTPGKTTGTTHL